MESRIDIGVTEDEAGVRRVDLSVDRDDGCSLAEYSRSVLARGDILDAHGPGGISFHVRATANIGVKGHIREIVRVAGFIDILGRSSQIETERAVLELRLRSKMVLTPPIGVVGSLGVMIRS